MPEAISSTAATAAPWKSGTTVCLPNRAPGWVATPSSIYDIEVAAGYAYLANYQAGILVVDVGNPQAPVVVSRMQTDGDIYNVTLSGSLLYACDFSYGLRVIDVSIPPILC